MIIRVESGHAHALVIEHQGAGRQAQHVGLYRQGELHTGVAARQQAAAGVVHQQLHQGAAGRGVHRIRSSDHLGVEGFTAILRHAQTCHGAHLDLRRRRLRHLHIHSQAADVRDREQLFTGGTAGTDQRPHIGGARGDHTSERCGQPLEALGGNQLVDVGLGRDHFGLLGGEVAGALIHVLARHRIRGQHRLPALGGGLRQRLVGLGRSQYSLGLQQLLIELWRVDFSQQLPGLYVVADVDVPGLEVAIDPGKNRRPRIRL